MKRITSLSIFNTCSLIIKTKWKELAACFDQKGQVKLYLSFFEIYSSRFISLSIWMYFYSRWWNFLNFTNSRNSVNSAILLIPWILRNCCLLRPGGGSKVTGHLTCYVLQLTSHITKFEIHFSLHLQVFFLVLRHTKFNFKIDLSSNFYINLWHKIKMFILMIFSPATSHYLFMAL